MEAALSLTPVHEFDGWWAKREDLAGWAGARWPSGAKVRQYAKMIEGAPTDALLVVGCSADAAMQIYVAAAGAQLERSAVIVVPERKERSPATRWCLEHGAALVEVRPGYPSVYRARARELAREHGRAAVRWDRELAALDTAEQCANLPAEAERVLVPCGTGLTAAGVLGGLAELGRSGVGVVAAQVSPLAGAEAILALAERYFPGRQLGPLRVAPARSGYAAPARGYLPDGMLLDPFYAAKALPYVRPGDVLWVAGRRPPAAA